MIGENLGLNNAITVKMKRKQPEDTFLLVCLNEDFWFIRFQVVVHLEAVHNVFSSSCTGKCLCYNVACGFDLLAKSKWNTAG